MYLITINFLKGEPVDDDPQVVEEGERDYHGPVVAETASRIEHEGPVRAGAQASARIRGAPAQSAPATAAQPNKFFNTKYDDGVG